MGWGPLSLATTRSREERQVAALKSAKLAELSCISATKPDERKSAFPEVTPPSFRDSHLLDAAT